ncbi:MAG: RHS repeat-associated core domain-containing protein, partial [Bacteroidota bacterium]
MYQLKFQYILFFAIVLLSASRSFAQINSTQSPMVNLPAAPEASALKEYIDIPVSEYTGTANVNIPLHTFKTKEISIPISIGYHSAGNRVTEEASWVGLGWSLNAGGVITREIKDKDDFGFVHPETQLELPGYYSNFYNQIDKLPGDPSTQDPNSLVGFDPLSGTNDFTVYFSQVASSSTYVGNDGNNYTPEDDLCEYSEIDSEPDLYSFNFLGYSGKFVLDDNRKFVPLSNHGFQIEYTDPGWQITTQDGIQFIFGSDDQSQQRTYSLGYHFKSIDPNNLTAAGYSSCANCAQPNDNFTVDHISSWFLREIRTVNGRVIRFRYDKEAYNEDAFSPTGIAPIPGFSENWLKSYHSCHVTCEATCNPEIIQGTLSASVSVIHYDRVDLEAITSSAPDVRESVTFIPSAFDRLDLKGAKSLNLMQVHVNSQLVKEVIFNKTYFTSSAPDFQNDWRNLVVDLPGVGNLIDNNNNLKRLRLESVSICGENETCLEQPYRFSYNNTALPAKTSMSQDYWGYFNGKKNKTLVPSFTYVRTPVDITPPSCTESCADLVDGCSYLGVKAADRRADENKSKACVLESVVSPLAGSTSFEYETHRFTNGSEALRFNSALQEIGNSSISTFNCLGDPNCTLPPTEINYPSAQITVSDDGTSLCGNSNTPVYFNASWSSNGCSLGDPFPVFMDVEISGIDDPSFFETVRLHETFISTEEDETWSGLHDSYVEDTPLGPPTIFLPPGNYRVRMLVDNSLVNCGDVYSASIKVAELVLSEANKRGGGLRVSRKITNDANGNILNTRFEYGNKQSSTGILNAIPDFTGEAGIRISSCAQVSPNGKEVYYNYFFNYLVNAVSSSLSPLTMNFAPGIVGYTEVTKYYDGQEEEKFGREVSTFYNEDFSASSLNTTLVNVPRFYNANNGNLQKLEIFDRDNTLVKETINTYATNWNDFNWMWTGKIICDNCLLPALILSPAGNESTDPDCEIEHNLWISYYSYIPQWHKLQSVAERTWGTDGSGPLTSYQSYTYDNQYFVPKTYTTSGASVGMTKEVKYAQDILFEGDPDIFTPAIQEMVNRNMTAIPLWEKTTGSVQSGSKVRYEFTNNLFVPTDYYAIEGDINTWEPQYELRYTDYTDDYPDEMQKDAYDIAEIYTWDNGLLKTKNYSGWNWVWGYNNKRQLTSISNVDGTSTAYDYDDLQRMNYSGISGKGGDLKSSSTIEYDYELASGGSNKVTTTTTYEDGSDTQTSVQTFDGFGRDLVLTRLGYTPQLGNKAMQSVSYDDFGRKIREYSIGQDPVEYQYEYSPLSRMLQIDNPDGSIVTMQHGINEAQEVDGYPAYTLFKTKTTDENGNISETFTDGLDRTRVNKEYLTETESADTYYGYDNYGNIGAVTTPMDYEYTYFYDAHNRLFQKKIPGGGTFEYQYYDNDLLFKSILPNGHTTFNYYDQYDRLEVTSLDGDQSSGNNIIENEYDINHSVDPNAAYWGKKTGQITRVLGTNDWLSATYTYDKFGRSTGQTVDNYVGGQEVLQTSLDYADNVKNINRVHSTSFGPDIVINTTNSFDHSFRKRRIEHQVDNHANVRICGMGYDSEDRVISKALYGDDPDGSLLQSISYGYNSRGWLTNINEIDDGDSNDKEIPICKEDPSECYKCDYTVAVPMSNSVIFGIYLEGGQYITLPSYPYDITQLNDLELDLETWLTDSGIEYQDVNIVLENNTAYITIVQSTVPFLYVSNFPNLLVFFTEGNCTGTPFNNPTGEICNLCNRWGYKCNDCPFWNLQDNCITCSELGILDCNSCAFAPDPCTRCSNLGYQDCATCPLTLDAIKPIRLTVDYNHSDLSSGTKASMISITEQSKYIEHDQTFDMIYKQSNQMVGSTNVSSSSPSHTMVVDLSDQWINANTSSAVLDTLADRLIAELNTAGISSTQVQNDFVDAVEQSLSITWTNVTGIDIEPEFDIPNPDLFALKIDYNDGGQLIQSPGQLNGNISGLTWKVAGKSIQSYSFWYDPLDRLKEGRFVEVQNQVPSQTNIYGVEMDYDLDGNISWLTRRGVIQVCDEGSNQSSYEYGTIDDLSYAYDTDNHLESITEAENPDFGYKGSGGTYDFNVAGNLTDDNNKDITVQYNFLNLPTTITFNSTGASINFLYDALGNKLRKIGEDGTRDYVGEIEYTDGGLEAIYHEEGRVTFKENKPYYEYFLKDHLGNTRVVFSDLNKDGYLQPFNEGGGSLPVGSQYTEILQESHYYPFGMQMNGPWDGLQPTPQNDYLYNGKELNTDFGLDWLAYGARMYDASIGRWNAVDPLADLYQPHSPYSYVLNRPTNAIDPDGRLIIFINGFDGFNNKLRASRRYWGRFATEVERHFDEDPNRSIFVHGGTNSGAGSRIADGYLTGLANADAILDMITDENGNVTETIKVITHSMGGAYGKGFVKALLKVAKRRGVKGVPVTLMADFDPFQAASFSAIDNVFTQQFNQSFGPGKDDTTLIGDWAGVANQKQENAEEYYDDEDTGSHNIWTFIDDIVNLKEGTYIWDGKNWILQGDKK